MNALRRTRNNVRLITAFAQGFFCDKLTSEERLSNNERNGVASGRFQPRRLGK